MAFSDMIVCLYVCYACIVPRRQKRASGPQELELDIVNWKSSLGPLEE